MGHDGRWAFPARIVDDRRRGAFGSINAHQGYRPNRVLRYALQSEMCEFSLALGKAQMLPINGNYLRRIR